ncbi:hypothetical protein ACFYXW_27605 [Streptomyces sp. NPDC001981]|uniref:hypothetical protein n=1 Tax=Streptomyces sp. NPDC001981 TaxID=3364628 RepID=UPI00369A716A
MDNDTDLRFALQISGTELAETPPPSDSPLGRLRLFAAANGVKHLTKDHVAQALGGKI